MRAMALLSIFTCSAVVNAEAGQNNASVAASSHSLIAECGKLKRQSDRDKCLELAVAAARPAIAPAPTPPQETSKQAAERKSADVFAAAQDMQSVISSGISYNDYGPYVQRFAIALDRYKANATLAQEREAVDRLSEGLEAMQDAREYWQADINFFSRNSSVTYPGGLPTDLAGTTRMVSKYGIPTRKADFWGLSQGAHRHEALDAIWKYAGYRVDEARSALASIPAS